MQSVSSRIWTCVAVSISYDDNHDTTEVLLLTTNSSICKQLNGVKHCYVIVIVQFKINHLFANSYKYSWLAGFYGISTFDGYLTPNPFLCK